MEFEENTISWKPILMVSLVLILVAGAAAYFLFFQGGLSAPVGTTETAQYREIVETFKKANITALASSSEFFSKAVRYPFEIPNVPLGNSNPFGL